MREVGGRTGPLALGSAGLAEIEFHMKKSRSSRKQMYTRLLCQEAPGCLGAYFHYLKISIDKGLAAIVWRGVKVMHSEPF